MGNADLFAIRQAAPVVNPPPSDRYLDRFNARFAALTIAPIKDDFDEMPWQLQRFVRSICAMAPYDPAPPPVAVMEDDNND